MKHCLHEVKVNLITLLFSTILCLFSCSKEKVVSNSLEEERSLDGQEVLDRSPIRVREARDWFTTTYGQQKIITNANTLLSKDLQVVPVWAFAQTGTYLSDPIVICPILPPAHSDAMSRLFLVFTKASSNQVATQLVIFRALDGSWSSGAPLKLENFSGVIASLDLQGNYAGKVHFIIEGVQLGEIDPQPDGRGLVNDNGNTGNLATQQPWWSTRAAAVIGYRHSVYTRTMEVPDTLTPVLIALAASMEHLHPLSLPPLAAGA